jgi:hypothetical protein
MNMSSVCVSTIMKTNGSFFGREAGERESQVSLIPGTSGHRLTDTPPPPRSNKEEEVQVGVGEGFVPTQASCNYLHFKPFTE